ncbi:hypothetical protein GP486_003356 [Trichoglossum hirsutum]|uniref:Uncharacterized protein n=1 Tax=Trichoglossum hirsutum TaxID=265104 RepID=A0A9P8LD94_9PEZI|nr:hypothetical protein GP486_003356 [Trichoglossum hirsutum]
MAPFANVPSNGAWVFGIGSVRSGLAIHAHRPDCTEDGMGKNREYRIEDVGDVHDDFDEQDEHGEYGDNNIVVRQAVKDQVSFTQAPSNPVADTMEDHIQVTPHQRCPWNRPVVGVGVEYLIRVGIEAILVSVPPQQRPVQIRSCDAKECKRSDSAGELKKEEPEKDIRKPPFLADQQHRECGAGVSATRAQAI